MVKKYSRTQVTKAGKVLVESETCKNKCEQEVKEAFDALSAWRISHIDPLDYTFSRVEKLVLKIDSKAIFAKRLKRLESIKKKLVRYENMGLWNMQDIWWCRIIVNSPKKLLRVLRELKKWPEFRKQDWTLNIKNYIDEPKEDGYRSIHLIGKFTNWKFEKRSIEIQLRTAIQHDWATALEIVDIFTKQNLKSNEWKVEWKKFFLHVSKEFELIEKVHLFSYSDKNSRDSYYSMIDENNDNFDNHLETKKIISKLKIIDKFIAFKESINFTNTTIQEKSLDWYVLIEINVREKELQSTFFQKEKNIIAEKKYIEKEKEFSSDENRIIALVSCGTIWLIEDAYPNYFADSTEFIRYLRVIENSSF